MSKVVKVQDFLNSRKEKIEKVKKVKVKKNESKKDKTEGGE